MITGKESCEEELQKKMETSILKDMVKPLLDWYDLHARSLPWRENPLPYYVWVSEIMLQQTRVEAVKPFFQRFIERLPDIKALAECPTEQLLKLWEGLGYYNRVRNMQKAAAAVMERHGGKLPADHGALLRLPGIGAYTAGAIASISFGIPVPAVDGNVLRVTGRLCENEGDIGKQSVRREVEALLQNVIPVSAPGKFNQALMDLGAMVCLPGGAPKCRECPLEKLCQARQHGREREFPVKSPKKPKREEKHTVLVIRDGKKTVLRRRPGRGLLAGLYEFPNVPGHLGQAEALEAVKGFGLSPVRITPLEDAKHIFSHVEWQMKGWMVLVEELEGEGAQGMFFVEPARTRREFPIPSAFAAYASALSIKIGQEGIRNEGETA